MLFNAWPGSWPLHHAVCLTKSSLRYSINSAVLEFGNPAWSAEPIARIDLSSINTNISNDTENLTPMFHCMVPMQLKAQLFLPVAWWKSMFRMGLQWRTWPPEDVVHHSTTSTEKNPPNCLQNGKMKQDPWMCQQKVILNINFPEQTLFLCPLW